MVEFIQKSGIPLAMVGLLQAMPGTSSSAVCAARAAFSTPAAATTSACNLNFIPRMDAARLVEGYRSVMKRIYSHEAYYARVKLLLSRCRPTTAGRLTVANLRAFLSSVVRQGMIRRGRLSYWKFMSTTALRHPRSFGVGMTLAVMGYHFQIMTRRLLEADH